MKNNPYSHSFISVKLLTLTFVLFTSTVSFAQPNWPAIKSNATFIVADTSYGTPYIQPLNVGGWEDGLYITRDGKNLYSTYLPIDAFSWLFDLVLNPICFDFHPYYRPPLLGIDTLTNTFGCAKFMQSDIIISSRADTSLPFSSWSSSNLQTPFSFDGGAQGVLKNADTFDVFVYTKDGVGTQSVDIMFMRNVPVNPNTSTAVPILSTPAHEDNPHIERLNDSTLVLIFDRDRYMHYSLSYDNGTTWQTPVLITNVLNDQAPYDVQPHLWHDGTDWWVYFSADNSSFVRGIYKSKQMIPNDWNSWGPKQLVIESGPVLGGHGAIYGIGEPSLTQWGDISFAVVYGNIN
ncbi:MAG: exo-alpha-sialidase, partial [Bacteroidia bacterium]|nr:exo-alpha-sialidase [Bacteroidia bacterium]